MKTSVIFTTCPNNEEASTLAKTLVSEQLVACINIMPPCRSIYTWQGEIQESSEVLLICKTRSELVEKLESRVLELHSYDTPEFVAFEASVVAPSYLKWINEVTL